MIYIHSYPFTRIQRSNSSENSVSNVLFSATNGVSMLVCLLAAGLVFTLRLYKIVVYRLALYQVLAALALATAELSQILMVNYENNPVVYGQVCVAIGWVSMYSQLVKLLFMMWVTFHLFCFAVFHMNLKKFEVLYVVTSLLVPAVIACVPLITRTYSFSQIDGCYIPAYVNNVSLPAAVIERFAFWEGPAMVILLASSTAMVFIVHDKTES